MAPQIVLNHLLALLLQVDESRDEQLLPLLSITASQGFQGLVLNIKTSRYFTLSLRM